MRADRNRLTFSIVLCATTAVAIAAIAAPKIAGSAASPAPKARIAQVGERSLFGAYAPPDLSQPEYERMARLGVDMARVHLSWRWIENNGIRNWGYFDNQVASAARAGVRVLPVVFGVPDFIDTYSTTPPVRSARERRLYRDFLMAAARRYGPDGSFWLLNPLLPRTPITAWQIWNEPNLPFYFGGKVAVRRYRDLLKLSARTLRAVDPGATIVTAGIFHYRTIPGSLSMKVFLKRFYRLNGIRKWFDVLALHPFSPRPAGVVRTIVGARRIIAAEGSRDVPVWVTEVGWTVGGVGWRTNSFRATKPQQAKRLVGTYQLLSRRPDLRVRRIFWHTFKDTTTPGRRDPWTDRMGLLTLRGHRRPAWYAYARVAGGQP